MNASQWITPREAQRATGLSHDAILQALGRGDLEGESINGRLYVLALSVARLAQFLRKQSTGVPTNATPAK